jgi:hypothetical protein
MQLVLTQRKSARAREIGFCGQLLRCSQRLSRWLCTTSTQEQKEQRRIEQKDQAKP